MSSSSDHAPSPAPCTATGFGGLRGIIAGAGELAAFGSDAVLGVVIETQGSTYRKLGALLLLDHAGVRVGALSGGCLEAELEGHAREVLASGIARDARFDTRGDEDRVFGTGTGCGGSMRVLLLPLRAARSPLRDALVDAGKRGEGVSLRLAATGARIGEGEVRIGSDETRTSSHRFDRHGNATDPVTPFDADAGLVISRPPRLLLLGAGPETPPMLRLTRMLGWYVELVENRQRWSEFGACCGIDRIHRANTEALSALLAGTRFDAALVMNHNFDLDARCLTSAADSAVPWLGLLGPVARRDDLLVEVGREVAARLTTRLHAPVGLPLGGEGAEAIALSIVAQLQEAFCRSARA